MDKLEALQLEFEATVEHDTKLACFLKEVEEKVTNMLNFKKTFLKFQLQVDTLLKKVVKKTNNIYKYIYIYIQT